jgi:glutathione S-transferase
LTESHGVPREIRPLLDAAMARGLADLAALANLLSRQGYVHGDRLTAIDAGIYGFVANIYFISRTSTPR